MVRIAVDAFGLLMLGLSILHDSVAQSWQELYINIHIETDIQYPRTRHENDLYGCSCDKAYAPVAKLFLFLIRLSSSSLPPLPLLMLITGAWQPRYRLVYTPHETRLIPIVVGKIVTSFRSLFSPSH